MSIKSAYFQNSNNIILCKISPKQIEYQRTYVNKKYKFDKCTLIIKLYKILFDDNIVICDYNMFNFKIYLILKL